VRISVAATSISLLIAIVLVVLSARLTVRPIEALAASARAISSGDFTHRVRVSTRDEVYELARAFNSMSSQLAQSLTSLRQEIAEREKTEEELERYRDQLEELVRVRTQQLEEAQEELLRQERLSALGQLTATVAHEIRNPLGTVRTAVFAIGDAIERQQMGRVERARQLAERNIVRCDDIIHELLDYSRDWTLRPQPTLIDAWLAEVLDEQDFPEDVICIREFEACIEIPIDQEHLRRAVVNVLENALDALQDDGAVGNQLTVGTHVVGESDVRLEIRVRDMGPGIPPDVLNRVFEPLFSAKPFGVGLGLPIVKSIVEKHSGGVEVQSEMGQGTTVVLWLPTLA
jgi:signal transduction histidine kinase